VFGRLVNNYLNKYNEEEQFVINCCNDYFDSRCNDLSIEE